MVGGTAAAGFDVGALFAALDAQRNDHPISPATMHSISKQMNTSCQHALFMLRWLGRAPESFVPGAHAAETQIALPDVHSDHRLRWNLAALYDALNAQRRDRAITWTALAQELRCTPSQLTGIRTARFAISMVLAMRIVGWLERPARDFI